MARTYSLAPALGAISAAAAYATPGMLIIAFFPMLFIAAAYDVLNRLDPG